MSDTTPPADVAAAARKGLELRERFGRGGTKVGVARAHQLSSRKALSPKDIKAMHSYFARHAVDKKATARKWGDDDDPSAGYVAWLLWGGGAGRAWADKLRRWMDE